MYLYSYIYIYILYPIYYLIYLYKTILNAPDRRGGWQHGPSKPLKSRATHAPQASVPLSHGCTTCRSPARKADCHPAPPQNASKRLKTSSKRAKTISKPALAALSQPFQVTPRPWGRPSYKALGENRRFAPLWLRERGHLPSLALEETPLKVCGPRLGSRNISWCSCILTSSKESTKFRWKSVSVMS